MALTKSEILANLATKDVANRLDILEGANSGDQLVFSSVLSDSGTAVADTTNDTLSIVGAGGITTSVVDDTLTIDGSAIGGGAAGVQSVGSMFELTQASTTSDRYMSGFYSGSTKGGGFYFWDAGQPKANANGGTIVDPANIGTFNGTQGTLASFMAAQGTGVGTGCWMLVHNGEIDLYSFGALGDGTTDDTTAWDSWFPTQQAYSLKGRISQGFYRIQPLDYDDTAGNRPSLSNDVNIEADRGARLKEIGTTGTGVGLLSFRDRGQWQWRVTWKGGIIDRSNGIFVGSEASSSGLIGRDLAEFNISDVYFYGSDTWRDGVADSGMSCIGVQKLNVSNNVFQGWSDLGLYPGGNTTATNAGDERNRGKEVNVTGNIFYRCAAACHVKRGGYGFVFSGNYVNECRVGISSVGNTSNNPEGSESMAISGNIFRLTDSTAVNVGPRGNAAIAGNVFYNCAWNPAVSETNPNVPQTHPNHIIQLQGCQNVAMTGNTFYQNRAVYTRTINALRVSDFVDATNVTYNPGNMVITGNSFDGIETIVRDTSTGGKPSIMYGNINKDNFGVTVLSNANFTYVEGIADFLSGGGSFLGGLSDAADTGVATTTHTRSLVSANNSRANSNFSACVATDGCNALSIRAGAFAASNCDATGNQTAALGSVSSNATGTNAVVAGSSISTATNTNTFVGGCNNGDAQGTQTAIMASTNSSITTGTNSFIGGTTGCSANGSGAAVVGADAADATGINSFVGGSEQATASGTTSAVLASANTSTASATNTVILGSNTCSAQANRSGVLSSNNSIVTSTAVEGGVHNSNNSQSRDQRQVIIGSQFVLGTNTGDNVADRNQLVMGNGSTTASVANRTIQLRANGGNILIDGAVTPSAGLDYAEYFPNATGEVIPLGSIVELQGEKVAPAGLGARIAGVVSATATVVGGAHGLKWQGRYEFGEFGEMLWEMVPDPEWEGEGEAPLIKVRKENPHFDPSMAEAYQPRENRPEQWTQVGLLGQVYVRVDQSVVIGQPVASGGNGVGTLGDAATGLRCMEITSPFDAEKGYAVARCMLNVVV